MGAPLVKAQQDSSVGIQDLAKMIMGGNRRRLIEQRLIPCEAVMNIGYANDRPGALHLAARHELSARP